MQQTVARLGGDDLIKACEKIYNEQEEKEIIAKLQKDSERAAAEAELKHKADKQKKK